MQKQCSDYPVGQSFYILQQDYIWSSIYLRAPLTILLLSLSLLSIRCITSSSGGSLFSLLIRKSTTWVQTPPPTLTCFQGYTYSSASLKTICELHNTEGMCPVMHHNPPLSKAKFSLSHGSGFEIDIEVRVTKIENSLKSQFTVWGDWGKTGSGLTKGSILGDFTPLQWNQGVRLCQDHDMKTHRSRKRSSLDHLRVKETNMRRARLNRVMTDVWCIRVGGLQPLFISKTPKYSMGSWEEQNVLSFVAMIQW